MHLSSKDAWREALKFINKCPMCATAYDTEQAELFAASDTAHVIHLTCPKCHSYFIAMVVAFGQGLSSIGMVTDLSFADAKRLYQAPPITIDETIGGYQSLQDVSFNSLLLKKKQ